MAASLSIIVAKDGAGATIVGGVQALDLSGAGTGPWSIANILVDGLSGVQRAAVVAVNTAPVTATHPALVSVLRPDSAGIITTGAAGSASTQVLSIQGIASMTPILATITIASGGVASGAIASGAFAAGSIAAGAVAAGALSFVKLEDSASADGDAGVPAMAIQKATPADTGGTDGDYVMLQMSAGRLWVAATTTKAPCATGIQSIVASSATSVTVLAANAARLGASVFNDSTQILYLLNRTGGTASTTVYSSQIPPNGYFEVPFGFTGALIGLWASANGNARVMEYAA